MLHVLRVYCPWRNMHERYAFGTLSMCGFGGWAEQSVWDTMVHTLVDLGLLHDWQHYDLGSRIGRWR